MTVQYINLLKKIVNEGKWGTNQRTKTKCLTLLNHTLTYDVSKGEFPLITTRKSYWRQAIRELICYIRGYTDLEQFHALEVNTWNANCKAWESVSKKSGTDLGTIYGASAKAVGIGYDEILDMLKEDPNDRGIIWNFWNPEYFNHGCLRPCMYSHQFNVVDGTLHLTSIQRSVDAPLGLSFNMVQCYFLLAITAKLTGFKAGTVTHHLVNIHIYENQLPFISEQISREPYPTPKLNIDSGFGYNELMFGTKEKIDSLLKVEGYQYHPAIRYPFTA